METINNETAKDTNTNAAPAKEKETQAEKIGIFSKYLGGTGLAFEVLSNGIAQRRRDNPILGTLATPLATTAAFLAAPIAGISYAPQFEKYSKKYEEDGTNDVDVSTPWATIKKHDPKEARWVSDPSSLKWVGAAAVTVAAWVVAGAIRKASCNASED